LEYKWKALSVTSVGALMSAVDSTVVLLALYPIANDLKTDFITMVWVIIAYLLVNTALVLSLGRLGDMYGRKKMYNIGFAIFTVGSALCGLAFSGIALVGFRLLQGAGAALLTANSFAILSEAFPRNETGKAFGVNAVVWSVGAVLGIILGGVIITYTTWRLIFLINVPIGIFATVWAYMALKAGNKPERKESFDLPAALMFTLALSSILLGVTWGLIYGWTSAQTFGLFGISPVFFGGFIVWEEKFAKDPIVDFSLFRNRIFSSSIIASLLQSMAVFSVNFLLIFYLEGVAGYSVLEAAYLIIPLAVASAVFGPIGGLLSDKLGPRIIATLGLGIALVALVLFTQLSVSTPSVYIAGIELLAGSGLGLFWPSNTSAIMSSLPPARFGVGSGIMNSFRNTGMIMSFAISLTAATSVLNPRIVYELFVGSLTQKLSATLATSYLSAESFAFEISVALLAIAIAFSVSGVSRKTAESKTAPRTEQEKTAA
jgi:EmrB/QacA subfamily drug resistance transporter